MARDVSEVKNDNSVESYLDRLFRMIPTEVTAAFLAINTMLGTERGGINDIIAAVSAILLSIIAPFILTKFANVKSRMQLFTAPFTFLIWAANIAVYRFDESWTPDKVLPTALILWTVLLLILVGRRNA